MTIRARWAVCRGAGSAGLGVRWFMVVPASLNGALEALDADKDYLLAGGVFTEDFISNWIAMKYEEVQQLRQRPHPHEFTMYYDA